MRTRHLACIWIENFEAAVVIDKGDLYQNALSLVHIGLTKQHTISWLPKHLQQANKDSNSIGTQAGDC